MGQHIDFDIVIVGGGIVGLATAYKIGLGHPGISIAVLEKEERLAAHQTGHNSGVIHSGLYYKPGSSKAKNCKKGRGELIAFAEEHNIDYEIGGKIIVATDKSELDNLEYIFRNGLENNIEGIKKITPDEIKEIEPFCAGIAGIHVPCTGVIDFVAVAEKLGELIETHGDGSKVLLSCEAKSFEKHDFFTRVVTSEGTFTTKYIINCGGLQSDRIAKMDGVEPGVRIIPFRGDYYELTEAAAAKVKSLIYPVPDPSLPFLGVHFTRTISGLVECGPNAVFSFKRESYGKKAFDLKDTWDSLSYPGLWKMLIKNLKYGIGEYRKFYSKNFFLKKSQKLIPSLKPEELKPGKTGVRAQAVGPRGELIDDFKVVSRGNSIHVLNAPSPAAAASLAIGEQIEKMAAKHFGLKD